MISMILHLLRIKQWIKNLLVIVPIVFVGQALVEQSWVIVSIAFFSFSLTASSIYILNDLLDAPVDRLHPSKRFRPIAAKKVTVPQASVIGFALASAGIYLSTLVNILPFILTYFILMILYSSILKKLILVDVIVIATGFTLRAVIGVEALQADISAWLLICTFLAALLLALIKRRQEVIRTTERKETRRDSLIEAPELQVWDHWISTISGITILAYILYSIDEKTIAKVGSNNLIYTIPFVVYGILIYTYLVFTKNSGEDPTETILTEKRILIAAVLWLISVTLVYTRIGV